MQYNKIEKQNSIKINVFGYEEKQPFPICVSKEKFKDQMNLLLIIITEVENKHNELITDFNKFMFNKTKKKERKYFCMYCLQCLSSDDVLDNHKTNCIVVNGEQAIQMPPKGNNMYTLKFNDFHKQLPTPFVIYANSKEKKKKTNL